VSDRKNKTQRSSHKHSLFTTFANHTARAAGHPLTFVLAVLIIACWAITGPIFGYSDTWQLIINTGTTIITFLMVFLIQNTQNRDSTAMHLKVDEIIRALEGAHNSLLNLEDLEEKELEAIHKRYIALAERARDVLDKDDEDVAERESEELTDLKRGGSARGKKRAERNRKQG